MPSDNDSDLKIPKQVEAPKVEPFSRRNAMLLAGGVSVASLAMLEEAKANTVFTSYGFPATGASTNRTMPDRLTDVFNVKDFGAVGNAVANDTTAINACLTAAYASGHASGNASTGAAVFFPAGAYSVDSTITTLGQSGNISIYGAGANDTLLFGNIATGFTLDKPDGGGGIGGITSLRDMAIANTYVEQRLIITTAVWSGGTTTFTTSNPLTDINWSSGTRVILISSINPSTMGGENLTGTRTGATTFTVVMADPGSAYVSGGYVLSGSGGTGALRLSFTVSVNIENLNLTGMIGLDVGRDQFQNRYANITVNGPGGTVIPGTVGIICSDSTFIGCNVLSCDVGYLLGGFSNQGDTGSPGTNIIGCRAESNITAFLVGVNLLGHAPGVGASLIGCQTERCENNFLVMNASPLHIFGGSMTGTVGVPHYLGLGSITWAAGTATVTIGSTSPSLDDYGWLSGDRSILIADSVFPGYNTTPNFVTGHRTGVRTFTYPVVSDPGGTDTFQFTIWSFKQQTGLKLGNCGAVLISGIIFSITDLEVGTVDLSSLNGIFVTLQGMNFGGSFVPPIAPSKASVQLDNCSVATMSMGYADLPGQPGLVLNFYLGGPIENMEYDIIDCGVTGFLAVAQGGGSGPTAHRRVRCPGRFSCTIARSGGTATVTTGVNHGLSGTISVMIIGADQTEYNGYVTATTTGVNTFTYTVAGSPATPATGTIVYTYWQVIG